MQNEGEAFKESDKPCKPFLKWAGGKRQLLPEIMARVPERFNTYFEPFLGAGAVFFGIAPQRAVLSDINPDLINAFQVVRENCEELIEDLSRHTYEENYYYQMRDQDRQESFLKLTKLQRASRLIFLNKTCYNGLYRVNSKGEFNVPFGRYSNPTIVDPINLRACARSLKKAEINCNSFELILTQAKRGDFIYFDPPYMPLSKTSSFTSYSADKFDKPMQEYLRNICLQLDLKGIKFMLSNSSHPSMKELYGNFKVEEIAASRAINSKSNMRGDVLELIITNY